MPDSLNKKFGHIYDQYINKIYRFVYLKVNSRETAEDITSKVFLKGWETYKNQTKSPKSQIINPGAFLYQIARNAIVDHYRDKGRTNIVSADLSQEIADPGTNAQDTAILSADVNTVRKAIQKLKKDHQDVIIWHYLEDMPIESIAKLLDKPAGTVRVMLHRGLKDLKDVIKQSFQTS